MLLRELFEAKARKIVAVMPGGFHPFHPGHKSLYDWAVKTFGQSNVYVAATNDTATRPFPFEVKKKLAAMAGVPESNFMQVKSPFNNREYAGLVDADTALVFVRSDKDKNEQPLPDQTKKNGEPGYLRSYTGKDLNTADEMGYMAYGPTINFDFSGMQIKSASELRATWPEMSDEDKLKAAKLMYGNGAPVAVKLLNQALGDTEAPVGEDVSPEDEKKFHNELDDLVHKYFGDSPDEEKMKKKYRKTVEKAPPGREKQVKALKKKFDDPGAPYAIAWAQHNKKKKNESEVVLDKTSLRNYIRDMIMDYLNKEDDVKKLSEILYNLVGKQVKHRGEKFTVTDEDINEILGFASKSPKRATRTVKRRPPEEDSVQDKIKKRRALASKVGVKKAFSSDTKDLDKYFGK